MGIESQQLLITQPTEQPPGCKPWSRGLGSLLLREDEDGRSDARSACVRLIALNPTLRSEAERLLPALEEAKAPASREEIIAVIAREMPAWGVTTKHAAEFGVTYASYADALEGLSLYGIEEGVLRWNRGEGHKDLSMGGYPPRPAQLYALAKLGQGELWMAAYRAKLALEHVEKTAPREISEEERQAVADGLKELAATFTERWTPQEQRPTKTPHQVAEELRAIAARGEEIGDVL